MNRYQLNELDRWITNGRSWDDQFETEREIDDDYSYLDEDDYYEGLITEYFDND